MIDRPAFPTLERTGGAIGAAAARQEFGLTGNGVGVAIIDSGITTYHDDLYRTRNRRVAGRDRVVHFKDFTRPASTTLWATEHAHDDYGHGTHVAGIIAGSGYDSNGARTGVAPGAHLIGLKVLDGDGHGYISDVIAAIDYAIALKSVLQHPRHQPVGRLRGRRVVPDGSADARRAPRDGCRHRRRRRRRQPRPQRRRRDAVRRRHVTGQRAVGADGRRQRATTAPPAAATMRLRRSARAVRRGLISPPSRTSSRPASASSR